MTHRRRQSEKAQEAMAEALSTLELGMPERIARANARADGAKTPIPPFVALSLPLVEPAADFIVSHLQCADRGPRLGPVNALARGAARGRDVERCGSAGGHAVGCAGRCCRGCPGPSDLSLLGQNARRRGTIGHPTFSFPPARPLSPNDCPLHPLPIASPSTSRHLSSSSPSSFLSCPSVQASSV